MGLVCEPLGACFHSLGGLPKPCLRLRFPAFEALHDQGEVIGALGRANERDQRGGVGGELLPFRRHGVQRFERFPDLPDGAAGDCRPLAQAAQLLALGFRLGGEADKFIEAIGEGGEVEAIGLDDPPVRITAAITLAGRAVAQNENTGLEQGAVEKFSRGQGIGQGIRPDARRTASKSGASLLPNPAPASA